MYVHTTRGYRRHPFRLIFKAKWRTVRTNYLQCLSRFALQLSLFTRLIKLNSAHHVYTVAITSGMSGEEIITAVVDAFEDLVDSDQIPVLSDTPNWELLRMANTGQGKRATVKPAGIAVSYDNCLRCVKIKYI